MTIEVASKEWEWDWDYQEEDEIGDEAIRVVIGWGRYATRLQEV